MDNFKVPPYKHVTTLCKFDLTYIWFESSEAMTGKTVFSLGLVSVVQHCATFFSLAYTCTSAPGYLKPYIVVNCA